MHRCAAASWALTLVRRRHPSATNSDAVATAVQTHYRLHLASLYVSSLACGTYTLLALDIPISQHDMNSIIFIPIRWSLYFTTVPAIWWILAHGSHYTLRRKLYVQFLMIVTLAAGGIATLPSLRWGHKMYWMTLACVPFPEICFHLWCALPTYSALSRSCFLGTPLALTRAALNHAVGRRGAGAGATLRCSLLYELPGVCCKQM